jgi:hypothetical protein
VKLRSGIPMIDPVSGNDIGVPNEVDMKETVDHTMNDNDDAIFGSQVENFPGATHGNCYPHLVLISFSLAPFEGMYDVG